MPIKAVVTDLDGTLLNAEHQISPYTTRVLHSLKERGIFFVVATGRPYADVFGTLQDCHLEPDFIITSNGARIHDKERKVVREHNMRPELVEALAHIRTVTDPATGLEAPKRVMTNVYREAEWLTHMDFPELKVAFHRDFHPTNLGEAFFKLQAEELHGVHEVWFTGDPAELSLLDKEFRRMYAEELCCTFSLPFILDCVPNGVAKGNAVREVTEVLGLTLDEVACFGDGMNDESMLKVTATSFIMSNGQQRLKDAVEHAEIIGSNVEDGVAKKLEEMFCLS